jgi:hypothetical protein
VELNIDDLYEEVNELMSSVEPGEQGTHVWSNYQDIVSIINRLTELHNAIAFLEIKGEASSEIKKFRTMILDPTIDNLNKNAVFESRKITGQQMEWELEKRG